jgi:cell division protein FtsQ
MAKRNAHPMTQRERQCRKVARDKAVRKAWRAWWLRIRVGLALAVALLVAAAGIWEWRAQGISRTGQRIAGGIYAMTAQAGFSVRALTLDGRSRTPLADVQKALGVERGAPIFGLSLAEIRARLEKLPTVKHAAVERALPDTLAVRLTERDPVALWQENGKLTLIDDEGAAMPDLSIERFRALPLMIGEGAPKHVQEALALLGAQPQLQDKVVAMVRIGDRRWNMRLKDGVEVRLPEENALAAWQRVAELQRDQQLLERAIKAVDLRQEGRIFIRLAPQVISPPKPANARET